MIEKKAIDELVEDVNVADSRVEALPEGAAKDVSRLGLGIYSALTLILAELHEILVEIKEQRHD